MQLAREQRALLLVGPDQAPAQVAQLLLGSLALRDVAEDAERDDHVSGGVAPGDAGHVMDPLLPMGRMQEAVLDVEPLQPPVVHLLALVHHAFAVVGMQMLDPELQGLEALFPVRGNTADVAKPVVDEGDALAEVHLVEREAGEVGARRQAGLACAKRLFGSLALGDVIETQMKCSGSPR